VIGWQLMQSLCDVGWVHCSHCACKWHLRVDGTVAQVERVLVQCGASHVAVCHGAPDHKWIAEGKSKE